MALPGINVDDRTYEQLLTVLRAQIPGDRWTDHNPSDPGMMLLELLCWLGEMTLYRMNRVPEAHQEKFLNLVIDPPEPVTVEVTFTLQSPVVPEFVIPAGTRLATDYADGRRFVFETIDELTLTEPAAGDPLTGTVIARELLEVNDEILGTSDGTANQTFTLDPPRQTLGLPTDRTAPVLLDLLRVSGSYDPNPKVTVDGIDWVFKPFLVTDESGPADTHFTVDPFTNQIRFGDDTFGVGPPAGVVIRCTSYRVLQGTAALVRKNTLLHLLNPDAFPVALAATETLTFEHPDAEGGMYVFPDASRVADGLRNAQRTHRVVTERDFEEIILEDFNEFEAYTESAPQIPDRQTILDTVEAAPTIRRVIVRSNRRPPLSNDQEQPAHVTLLVLPDFDPTVMEAGKPLAPKQAAITVSSDLEEKITRFLDTRRLITTRVHLEAPELTEVDLTARVVVSGERRSSDMETRIREDLHAFLSLLEGGPEGTGWPAGRAVYPSEVYRRIESLDGVDHVLELVLSPTDADGKVPIEPHQLPVLNNLLVSAERTAEFGGSS